MMQKLAFKIWLIGTDRYRYVRNLREETASVLHGKLMDHQYKKWHRNIKSRLFFSEIFEPEEVEMVHAIKDKSLIWSHV